MRIVVRGGSGSCRARVLRRLERPRVQYVLELQKNPRLQEQLEYAELALAEQFKRTHREQRLFGDIDHAADSCGRPRRVIGLLEHREQGAIRRSIVTNLAGTPRALQERRGCARAEAENRIKAAQLDLFGRRASCLRFWPKHLRLLLPCWPAP